MDHLEAPVTDLDFGTNLNILNQKEHQEQLKKAFVDKALPIFLKVLCGLLTSSFIIFANERWTLLESIMSLFGQFTSYVIKCLSLAMTKAIIFWIRHKKLCLFAISLSTFFLITGICLRIVLGAKNARCFSQDTDFGEFMSK